MTRASRILAAVSAGLIVCFAARGNQSVSLEWNPTTDPANAGYIVYYGTASHSYPDQINVGLNTVVTLSGLQSGQTYYFAVGGFDSSGVAGVPSNEASFVAPTNTVTPPPTLPASVIVSPSSAAAGTTVYIYGTNLNATSTISFNGLFASFTVVSNSVLAAVVPAAATTGPLLISTPNGTITSQFTVITAPPPANDDYLNAQILSGTVAFAWDDTTWATKEPGEPNHCGNGGGASVWYRWTAPSNGLFTLDTTGTEFDSMLAVYTGRSIVNLNVVASNTAPVSGPVTFQATQGVTYQIAVDGFNGTGGPMQLRLSPALSSMTVFADTFEPAGGVLNGLTLAGQNGWVSSTPKLTGVAANNFTGYGQQGFIGFAALTLSSNTALLYHPLNYKVDTNNLPIVQFSVLLQTFNILNASHDSFGWVFRNANEQELFGVIFNNATGQITYTLDDGAGQRPSGSTFATSYPSQLIVTADFSRNQWSATINGATIIAGQPITTSGAALTLGDIDAKAIYPGLLAGSDGMMFDNYTVTAMPEFAPRIVLAPQNQTITVGSDLVLGVIASGNGPLLYQWYFNNAVIPGATNDSLWLSNAVPADGGIYAVAVANANGKISAGCSVSVSYAQAKALLASPGTMGASGRMLNFEVASGSSYHVQASANLITWSTIGSFYANGSTATFFDPNASSFPRRFYRLVSP